MLENPQAVVHRINELLKPGGVFISVTACMGDTNFLLSTIISLVSRLRIVPVHINKFKLTELQGIFTGEGFQILEYEKMDDSLPHYCIVVKKP